VNTPRELSSAYRLAVRIARPPLTVFTRQDWRGAEFLPHDRGFIACGNHISHLDPFTLAHFLYDKGCPQRFLAKESLFRIPLLGRIVSGAGQTPVYRDTIDGGKAFAAAVTAVEAGECLAIYPEATLPATRVVADGR
jgi:1-acyl-sn-glycerol-3-phosphate acyltransferase